MTDEGLLKSISENEFIFLAKDCSQGNHRKRCLILQTGAVHEEIIPSIVYILNNLGFHVDIYLNQKSVIRKGNIFDFFNQISYRLFLVNFSKKENWFRLTSEVAHASNYDLLVSNTFQRAPICEWISSIELPSICIIHNVDMFFSQDICTDYFYKRTNACPVFLSKHVYKYSLTKDLYFSKLIPNNSFIYPIYFENLKANPTILSNKERSKPRKFVVQGSINYANRDYSDLIAAISQVARDHITPSSLEVTIVGNGADRDRLLHDIKESNVQDYFRMLDPNGEKVAYDQYYAEILSGDFLLPLISDPTASYLSNKISSSLMIVFGMRIIPIINSIVANTYGIDDIVYYKRRDLKNAILSALYLDPAKYSQLQSNLIQQHIHLLQNSIENMERILKIVVS